jgi:hypothetical protein
MRPWPSYLATDYALPAGHPHLSEPDVAELRSILSQVTPCQRKLLRYTIAKNGPFVIFFLPTRMPFTDAYALNQGNVVYNGYDGTADLSPSVIGTDKERLQYAIKHTGCDGLWPRYFAEDYGRPDHPPLTAEEAAEIHWMLARVKPCQRRLLTYAFNSDGPSNDKVAGVDSRGFVMFFAVADPYYRWLAEPHVLGGQNILYSYESGRVAAFPNTEGTHFTLRDDIDRTGCNGKRDAAREHDAFGRIAKDQIAPSVQSPLESTL